MAIDCSLPRPENCYCELNAVLIFGRSKQAYTLSVSVPQLCILAKAFFELQRSAYLCSKTCKLVAKYVSKPVWHQAPDNQIRKNAESHWDIVTGIKRQQTTWYNGVGSKLPRFVQLLILLSCLPRRVDCPLSRTRFPGSSLRKVRSLRMATGSPGTASGHRTWVLSHHHLHEFFSTPPLLFLNPLLLQSWWDFQTTTSSSVDFSGLQLPNHFMRCEITHCSQKA